MRFHLHPPVRFARPADSWPDKVLLSRGPHPSLSARPDEAVRSIEAGRFGSARLVEVDATGAWYRCRRRWLRRPSFGYDFRRVDGGDLRLVGVVVTRKAMR
jgi:hypothetical protein